MDFGERFLTFSPNGEKGKMAYFSSLWFHERDGRELVSARVSRDFSISEKQLSLGKGKTSENNTCWS